ncbi:hypothetical protein D3C81_1511520 [compost metagenome]
MDDDAVERDLDHIALFEVDDAVRGAGHGERVGREEGLVLAQRHHQRRAGAGADHHAGLVLGEHGDGIGAVQALGDGAHRAEQVAAGGAAGVGVGLVDQVGDDFGVGLRVEAVADRAQFLAQRLVVLDDAVMHQRDGLARQVGVGVDGIGLAMGGPARVPHAGEAGQARSLRLRIQVGHARHGAGALDRIVAHDGDAARVIAAVFQAAQPLDQDRNDIARGNRADDATHLVNPPFGLRRAARRNPLNDDGRPSPGPA